MSTLVAAGADVTAQDEAGNTALSNAAFAGQRSAAAWLLDHGAEVNARDKKGLTPFSVARRHGHMDVAVLIEVKGGTE